MFFSRKYLSFISNSPSFFWGVLNALELNSNSNPWPMSFFMIRSQMFSSDTYITIALYTRKSAKMLHSLLPPPHLPWGQSLCKKESKTERVSRDLSPWIKPYLESYIFPGPFDYMTWLNYSFTSTNWDYLSLVTERTLASEKEVKERRIIEMRKKKGKKKKNWKIFPSWQNQSV